MKKIFDIWFSLPEKLRFLLVGGYNTVVSYCFYALFLYASNKPQLSLFLSFVVSSVNSFWSQRFFVFQSKGKIAHEYIRCLSAWTINYFFNVVLLFLFTKVLNPYMAQLLAVSIITVSSYLMLKHFAFKVRV